MKAKTIPTEPFLFTYKVWDAFDCIYVFKSSDLEEVYGYHKNLPYEMISQYVDLKDRYCINGGPYTIRVGNIPRYIIHDHFGDKVQMPRIKRRIKNYSDYSTTPDICYRKGNPNKIKRGYHKNKWDGMHWSYMHDFISGGYFRAFSNTNERRANCGDACDYGVNVVRGGRRMGTLIDPWDDIPNSTAKNIYSWKTHSKRRKQWKPKD